MKENNFRKQVKFLRRIRTMSYRKLKQLHTETFRKTKFPSKLPEWINRDVLETRLFHWYAVKHYHFPKDSKEFKRFKAKARRILETDYRGEQATREGVEAEYIENPGKFQEESVLAMPLSEVDTYLAVLGLSVEGPDNFRRRCLIDYFNENRRTKRKYRKFRKNQYVLRDIILAHPEINYDEFLQLYKDTMPNVSHSSFYKERSALRKAGYEIPPLPRGPKPGRARIVKGES